GQGHTCRCWHRAHSDRSGFDTADDQIEWADGSLGNEAAARQLVAGCDALVHAALERPQAGSFLSSQFTPDMGMHNVAGSLQLFEAAKQAGTERIVFISSCAVYGEILQDRP